ncbi:MAG: hypothetical protein AAF485_31085 [Chloroflexota bacterium]
MIDTTYPLNHHKVGALSQLTDLIIPAIKWQEEDYTNLQVRLDIYEHYPLLTFFEKGEITSQFIAHPAAIASALTNITLNSGLLPKNTLWWGQQQGAIRMGVYIPPDQHLVSIRNEAEAWRIPLPGLIFVGHRDKYACWAVKETPTHPHIPIFHAPCPNVHPEGVCRGNAPFPRAEIGTIWQAIEVFFRSRFNQDLGQKKSRAYPDDILERWLALKNQQATTYPLDDLMPTGLTLKELIDG